MRQILPDRHAETAKTPSFFAGEPLCPPSAEKRRAKPKRRWRALLVLAVLCFGVLGLAWFEARTAWLQAHWLPDYARSLSFDVAEGTSDNIRFPVQGPFDQRLGYVLLPAMLGRLEANGFFIDRQVRFSAPLRRYVDASLYPPYREKTHAGLAIQDMNQQSLFDFRYPRHTFSRFEDIPPLMVDTLVFIEDRLLLSEASAQMNPAVNWGRFLKAAVFKAGEAINVEAPAMGGSTLATQIEKFRHSERGITGSAQEKLRQMVSASVRVYQQGEDTQHARRQLVLDYLNTVPLTAAPGYGEVNGIGDGLYVWFGVDPSEVNYLLQLTQPDAEQLPRQSMALRQVLALMVAHRRPSYYLLQNRRELSELVDAHERLLLAQGLITPALAQAGVGQGLSFRDFRQQPAVMPTAFNKGVNVVRNRLVSLLNVPPYDLDRMDLSVTTTLEKDLQAQVTAHLRNLKDPAVAAAEGLVGNFLLAPEQAKNLRYSFTLFERSAEGNQVRVQTDNTDIPFDINEGSKLELGSTAKLRVLASYLTIIAELYQAYTPIAPDASVPQTSAVAQDNGERDPLTRWVQAQLSAQPDLTLTQLLAAALERRYSANPNESFFTGGGLHTFSNFRREDNGRNPTVREALNESINLPFVRMLRDVISHITHQQWQDLQAVMKDDNDPRRREVLARFADQEGTKFLSQFWRKYVGQEPEARIDTFLLGLSLTPVRAAVIHRYLYPSADLASFSEFMTAHLPQPPDARTLAQLYERYAPGRFNLQDLGYLARVHPLELWLVGYLLQNGNPSYSAALAASADQRQEVYRWLSRTRARSARDSRIRTMLEVQAFAELHRRWQRLGFPFEHLVPSLATALGSSGDRPAALAELMGIVLNHGERMAPQRISRLVFAADTPYETQVSYPPASQEVVMTPEVAEAMKLALADVVNKGTGRRLRGAYKQADGSDMIMGGKTGTGDNRLVSRVGGQRITGRALSRTATLVFYIGDNHFGTLTAFVVGDEAGQYHFTSALPTQVLRGMAPILEPYIQQAPAMDDVSPVSYPLGDALPDEVICEDCVPAAEVVPSVEESVVREVEVPVNTNAEVPVDTTVNEVICEDCGPEVETEVLNWE